jgi:hypothetical protein
MGSSTSSSSHGNGSTYGTELETPVIVIMSIIIVASLLAVTWMIKHYTPECRHSDFTYCGEPASTPH